jgi:tyrosyl-tRNA synthetase
MIGKTHKWWFNQTKENQVNIFRYWKKISTSARKHLCLNQINESNEDINKMLKEIIEHSKTFSLSIN